MGNLNLSLDGRLSGPTPLDEPRLRRLMAVLNEKGEETRVVGGAVRNALLGAPPGDIDLATTAEPPVVMARAKRARLRTVPTGVAHGTVTVMVDGHRFEVTTLREDVETDGRHAVVRFGRDFDADARRRDFTVNALSFGVDGIVRDTVGGLDDLAAGRIRFIGDARTRIREDYLRILRFFRFHATYGLGPLDPDGLAAATGERDGILRLSRERVGSEVLKLLAAPGAVVALRAMARAGILDLVLGGGSSLERLARLVEADDRGDAILRLAALALSSSADVGRLRDRLRLSNAESARLSSAREAADFLAGEGSPPPPERLRAALFEHGRAAALDGLALARAGRDDAAASEWQEAGRFLAEEPEPRLPFSGADLLARGLKGPEVGEALAGLRRAWAAAGFPADTEALASLLDAAPKHLP